MTININMFIPEMWRLIMLHALLHYTYNNNTIAGNPQSFRPCLYNHILLKFLSLHKFILLVHIPYNANRSRWKSFAVGWSFGYSWENFRDCTAIRNNLQYKKDKNSLENLRDWRLIHENCKSFPPLMICIIR